MRRVAFLWPLSQVRARPQYRNEVRRDPAFRTLRGTEVTRVSGQAKSPSHGRDGSQNEPSSAPNQEEPGIRLEPSSPHASGPVSYDTASGKAPSAMWTQEERDTQLEPSPAAAGPVRYYTDSGQVRHPWLKNPLASQTRFLFHHTPSPVATLTTRLFSRPKGAAGQLTSSLQGTTVTSLNPLSYAFKPLLTMNIFLGLNRAEGLADALISPIPPKVVLHLLSASPEGAALSDAFRWGLTHRDFSKDGLVISAAEDGLPLVQWDHGYGPAGVRAALICNVRQNKIVIGDFAVLVLEVKDVLEPVSLKENRNVVARNRAVKEDKDNNENNSNNQLDDERTETSTSSATDARMIGTAAEEDGTTTTKEDYGEGVVPSGWKRAVEYPLEAREMELEGKGLIQASGRHQRLGPSIKYFRTALHSAERRVRLQGKQRAQGLERVRLLRMAGWSLGTRHTRRREQMTDMNNAERESLRWGLARSRRQGEQLLLSDAAEGRHALGPNWLRYDNKKPRKAKARLREMKLQHAQREMSEFLDAGSSRVSELKDGAGGCRW
ncbi:MAG: hypothetical protein M1816_008112 [Peltula sp. TS41687]|nr:MAG: hypothetical protein M1816_008112 [Peltula sp. TS41687]